MNTPPLVPSSDLLKSLSNKDLVREYKSASDQLLQAQGQGSSNALNIAFWEETLFRVSEECKTRNIDPVNT